MRAQTRPGKYFSIVLLDPAGGHRPGNRQGQEGVARIRKDRGDSLRNRGGRTEPDRKIPRPGPGSAPARCRSGGHCRHARHQKVTLITPVARDRRIAPGTTGGPAGPARRQPGRPCPDAGPLMTAGGRSVSRPRSDRDAPIYLARLYSWPGSCTRPGSSPRRDRGGHDRGPGHPRAWTPARGLDAAASCGLGAATPRRLRWRRPSACPGAAPGSARAAGRPDRGQRPPRRP
jgi:hypothetical protein